ncbi:RNA polymerase sigma-70 factor [Foetidibacter luteolus]|uniref:RNA polymerase sigma-70 factor n=1 Tax=Foetidibacter luteolus TaxID=2608880 RepID=UPI00129A97C0|nr:RNA polymerase sigma-70 factor [Foetidibacter luteolus]
MDELLQHIRDGNRQSFNDFYLQYHAKLYQYIFKYTRSEWLAEETVQLSFVRIWEKRQALSVDYALSTQLFRVAKSIVIDLLRKGEVRKTAPLTAMEYEPSFNNEDIESKSELALVMKAIETLPPVRRKVFEYSRFENLSHKEISSTLSISTKTVETHISKAIRHLRKSLSFF